MILVLAGTSEARAMVKALLDEGEEVIATVTTEYGRDLLNKQGLENVIVARLRPEEFKQVLEEKGVELVIDATHPFATEVSKMALEVTKEINLDYIRLERQRDPIIDNPLIKKCDSLEETVETAFSLGTNIFSALGSKHLEYLWTEAKAQKKVLTARMLPTPNVMKFSFDLGLRPQDIVAVKGPFSKDLNKAVFKDFQAEAVITKESGNEGGLQEKIDACLELSIPLVVWQRPKMDYPVVCHTPQAVIKTWKSDGE